MSTHLNKIADAKQALFQKADEVAIKMEFIKRKRQFTDSSFLKILIVGWMKLTQPTIKSLARGDQTHNVSISAQGLDQRFNPTCSD